MKEHVARRRKALAILIGMFVLGFYDGLLAAEKKASLLVTVTVTEKCDATFSPGNVAEAVGCQGYSVTQEALTSPAIEGVANNTSAIDEVGGEVQLRTNTF